MQSIKKHITGPSLAFLSLILLQVLLATQKVFAETDGVDGPPVAGGLTNPLKSNTITGFLTDILDILLTFAVPVIIFFIIYSGYLFVVAQGDTTKITDARRSLTWSVVGGLIILGANLILDVIKGTIDAL